jgi:hypothetical protein
MSDNKIIGDYLIDKGIKISNLGFSNLITAIKLCLEDRKNLQFIGVLNQKVGEINGYKASQVEKTIRFAISNSNEKGVVLKEFIARSVYDISNIIEDHKKGRN